MSRSVDLLPWGWPPGLFLGFSCGPSCASLLFFLSHWFVFGCPGSLLRFSLVVAHGLLISVASPVAELGLLGSQASVVVAHGLSCVAACGTFLDQGSNLCPLPWPLEHQGSRCASLMFSFLVGKCWGVELLGLGVRYVFSFVESHQNFSQSG